MLFINCGQIGKILKYDYARYWDYFLIVGVWIMNLSKENLAEPILSEVELGKIGLSEAFALQAKIEKRLAASRLSIAKGKGIIADHSYFENLQNRALERRKEGQ